MAMDKPSYDQLLLRLKVESSDMEQVFEDDHLRELASKLVNWELLAKHINLSDSEIEKIKHKNGDLDMQKITMLEFWKQKYSEAATYEAMAKVLYKLNKTKLTQEVMSLTLSLVGTTHNRTPEITANQSPHTLTTSTSPAIISGMENVSITAAMPLQSTVSPHNVQDVTQTLRELEEEYLKLVTFTENALEERMVPISTLTRRFSILPQSIKRQHQTDENYKKTRRRILNSETIKEFFDNLTNLKYMSYMMPETLKHIVQLEDVDISEVHQKIETYECRLTTFRRKTKLRDITDEDFPVPDYYIYMYMELKIKVKGWEDKTIEEARKKVASILRKAVNLTLKEVRKGCIQLTFILTESIDLSLEMLPKICKNSGVISIQIDGKIVYSKDQISEAKVAGSNIKVPASLWYSAHKITYQAFGGRDVLIIAPDLPLPHPEAVARRPGQLTEKDKLKLQSQGVSPDCHDELDIVEARHKLEKRHIITGVKSGQSLSREDVFENIAHLLTTTQNDGVVLHYIGAGRRNTGDWCFEDGFITFRDITQLYLRASHNFKGRILTIVSDCSYSGCWVRDCMEFLDKQGVQPCGHKAREKGMVIKVLTSCMFDEIPTEYRYSVSGICNYTNTGLMAFYPIETLLETQTTDRINSSLLSCNSKTIKKPCTLPFGLTWSK